MMEKKQMHLLAGPVAFDALLGVARHVDTLLRRAHRLQQ